MSAFPWIEADFYIQAINIKTVLCWLYNSSEKRSDFSGSFEDLEQKRSIIFTISYYDDIYNSALAW